MKFTYSRFAYFDTNIISYLAKEKNVWSKLRDFLFENNLTLAISGIHLAELSNVRRNHDDLKEMLLSIPSALVKNVDVVISEEIGAYPDDRDADLLYYPIQYALLQENGIRELEEQLGSYNLRKARVELDKQANSMAVQIMKLKQNFPTSKSGKYIREQGSQYSKEIVWQWLSKSHPEFTKNTQKEQLDATRFKTVWVFSQMCFYRYYLNNRTFSKTSDFGDLHHCLLLSYCDLIVMERDLANLLKQIQKRNNQVLQAPIHDIDFLYQQGWKQKP
ncbi:MAG: hypothetical protein KIT07_03510 [Anaerolineales bacterium]|jgi:hypothetical protein|nr:hypothetical protein [Burkholderiales bacterium]MCW5887173.1 hypothetical protein [Anaerolineales bacterium]